MNIPSLGVFGPAALALGLCVNCSAPPDHPGDGELPPAALAAFQDHLAGISDGALVCPDAEIEAARRVTAFINADAEPDFVLETRVLNCRETRGRPAVAYFCGSFACAFPLLVSGEEGWQVVTLMSGNHVQAREHYRETRLEVREIARSEPGGRAVAVREYAWRDGALTRIGEWVESSDARLGSR
jgi:hypothetical protein